MERLTTERYGSLLIKNNDGEYRSPCFGCETINKCHSGKTSLNCGFYTALKQLKEYEDLEEQGKLLKLPCAVGDTVYHVCIPRNEKPKIIEMKVGCVEPCGAIRNYKETCEVWNVYAESDYTKAYFKFFDFDKTVFLTRGEAESTLGELSKSKEGK